MILPNVNDAKRIQTEFEYAFEGSGKVFEFFASQKALPYDFKSH